MKNCLGVGFLLALVLSGPAQAQTTWKNAEDGEWSNASAWTAGVPNGNAALLTNTAASYAVSVSATPATPYGDLTIANASANTTLLNVNAPGFTSTNGVFVFGRGAEVVVNSGGVMQYRGRPAAADFIQIKDGGVWRLNGGTLDFSDLHRTTPTSGNTYLYVGKGSTGRLEIAAGELSFRGTTAGEINNTACVRVGSGAGGVGDLVMTGGRLTVYNSQFNAEGLRVGADAAGCRGSVSLSGDAVMVISNAVRIGGGTGYTGIVDVAGTATLSMPRQDASHEVGNQGHGTITVRENGTLDRYGTIGGGFLLGESGGIGILNVQDNGTVKLGYGGLGMCSRANGGTAELNISGGRCVQWASGYGLQMSKYWDANKTKPTAASTVRISGGELTILNGYWPSSGGIIMARLGTDASVRALATMEISGGAVTNKGWAVLGWHGFDATGLGDWIAATGTVTQTGGQFRQTSWPVILGLGGGFGSYTISGGLALISKHVYVGGSTTTAAGTTSFPDMNDPGSVGWLRVDGGEFNVTNAANLCVGYNGTGTLVLGAAGLCVAENIILSNQPQSIVRFELGKQGVGVLRARAALTIAEGSRLEVDSRRYKGVDSWVKLIDYQTRTGDFTDIAVTGGGEVVQKDDGIWLHLTPGTVITLR